MAPVAAGLSAAHLRETLFIQPHNWSSIPRELLGSPRITVDFPFHHYTDRFGLIDSQFSQSEFVELLGIRFPHDDENWEGIPWFLRVGFDLFNCIQGVQMDNELPSSLEVTTDEERTEAIAKTQPPTLAA